MRKLLGLVMLVLAASTAGCGALGLGGTPVPSTSPTTDGGPVSEAGWLVSQTGKATPSPGSTLGKGTPKPALPPVSFLPVVPGCSRPWVVDPVLIPMTITPVAGGLSVTWPRQYDSDYRIAAIPQPLVSGSQPAYTWKAVPAPSSGCTVTTTVTGLKAGTPYVLWLDAPNSGYQRDGTRHPYAGESKVVYPL